jgi:hypothetical protein
MDCLNARNAICIAKTRHSVLIVGGRMDLEGANLGRILTMMLEDPIKGGKLDVNKIRQISIIHL